MTIEVEFPKYHPVEGQLYIRTDSDAVKYEVYICLAGLMYSLNHPGEYISCEAEDCIFERLPTGTKVTMEQNEV